MHDVIRDMALRIVSDDDTKIAVLEDADLIENNGFEKFKQVKRLALLGMSFENLNETQPFPCPLTLLVRDTKLNRFPNGFFHHVQVQNILDLSRNWNLCELPTGIKVLINLQHLNISYIRINSLPHEVKDLIKLKSLVMDGTYMLTDIPKEVISRLLPLQMFSKKQLVRNKIFDECGLLEELDSLENMTEMCITLTTLDSIEKFLSSSKLERCITELWVSGCNNLTSLKIWSLRRRAKQLERLEISKCKLLKEFITYFDEERYVPDSIPIDQDYFLQLRYLKILDCPGIKDLAWVVYAPSIETIILDNCCSIVEILPDYFRSVEIEEEQDIFFKLAILILSNLPKLERICKKTLPFHSLKLLRVIDCSCLKELPFDSNSAKKSLQVIQSTQEWWNSLQWKDEAKHAFTSKFRPWISQKQTEKSSVSVGIREAMKHVVLTELMEKEKEFMTKNSDILEMATTEELPPW